MGHEKVCVYGATGYTGKLVAKRLAGAGVALVLSGRSATALDTLADELEEAFGQRPQCRVATVEDDEQLDRALVGVRVLVNCAGPFGVTGQPLVEAALRSGAHYVDIAGEQAHLSWVAACHERAEERGQVLLPGCAFEFALGDLAAEIAWVKAASRIVVAYVVKDAKLSQGTKRSLLRTFAERGTTFVDGHHEEKKIGYRLFDVPLPDGTTEKGAWVPGGEAITVPRRGGVSWVETCVVAGEGTAYFVATFSGVIPPMLRAVQNLADKVLESSDELDETENVNDEFLVVAFDPKHERAFVTLRGSDIYATSARVVAEAAVRLLKEEPVKTGFVGAADLFDPADFLAAAGLEVLEPS